MKIDSFHIRMRQAGSKIRHGVNRLDHKIANIEPKALITKSKKAAHSLKEMKGRAKLVLLGHLLMGLDSMASVSKQIAKAVAESMTTGSSQSASFTLAGTILGTFSIAVQVIATGLDGIKLHSLRKQAKKFKEAAINNRASEYLVDKAQKAKGLRKLLNPITKNQTARIAKIFDSSLKEMQAEVIGKINKRFSHLKMTKAIGIALGVIALVGLILLTCTPNPLAPIAWGVLGTAMGLTALHVLEGFIADYRFSKYTKLKVKEIDGMGTELSGFA